VGIYQRWEGGVKRLRKGETEKGIIKRKYDIKEKAIQSE